MRRALAVVGAALMIATAFAIRSWRSGPSSSEGTDPAVRATVVCATELRRACDALAGTTPGLVVQTEDPAATAARLAASGFDPATAGVDGWIVAAPWPAMVDEARQRAGAPALFGDAPVLSRSPLVMVAWADAAASLRSRCGGDPGWRCVGEVAGRPWSDVGTDPRPGGDVKIGLPDPARGGTGLLLAGQATAAWFGRTDVAANDFSDEAFAAWLRTLARGAADAARAGGSNSTQTPLDRMLSVGRPAFDLTGSTEADAAAAVATSRDRDRLVILYPSPAATADLLMAPLLRSPQHDALLRIAGNAPVASSLAAAGWRTTAAAAPGGARTDITLAGGNGLPRAGVLDALRARWQEAAR